MNVKERVVLVPTDNDEVKKRKVIFCISMDEELIYKLNGDLYVRNYLNRTVPHYFPDDIFDNEWYEGLIVDRDIIW